MIFTYYKNFNNNFVKIIKLLYLKKIFLFFIVTYFKFKC